MPVRFLRPVFMAVIRVLVLAAFAERAFCSAAGWSTWLGLGSGSGLGLGLGGVGVGAGVRVRVRVWAWAWGLGWGLGGWGWVGVELGLGWRLVDLGLGAGAEIEEMEQILRDLEAVEVQRVVVAVGAEWVLQLHCRVLESDH